MKSIFLNDEGKILETVEIPDSINLSVGDYVRFEDMDDDYLISQKTYEIHLNVMNYWI